MGGGGIYALMGGGLMREDIDLTGDLNFTDYIIN